MPIQKVSLHTDMGKAGISIIFRLVGALNKSSL